MFDTIITGGDVVDGTGASRRRADVAITNGRIADIAEPGTLGNQAKRVIDASGRVVAPGFIDVHTHYDAQAFWDTSLSPSPLHGITTIIGGNCGFTIAPLGDDPAHGEYLMTMLSRVEGMPLETLRAAVPWNWSSTAEYLDLLDGTLAVNTGFKVGHSAIRRVVMGDDAVRRPSTPEELAAMCDLLRAGLEAGGIGFSTSWARTHNDPLGNMVPSRSATKDELIALATVTGEFEGTSIEMIPQVGPFEDWAMNLMADMSVAAQRTVNWNVLTVNSQNQAAAQHQLSASDVAAAKGGRVVALTVPLSLSLRLSLAGGFILDAMPGWEEAMLLPKAEKMALLADPEQRRLLDGHAQAKDNPLRGVARWREKTVFATFHPDNEQYQGRTIGEIAEDESKDPFDVLCDIALTDELLTSFGTVPVDEPDADWQARVDVWRDDRAVIGASDAGAHLDLFLSANYATVMLGEAVRKRGLMPIEEAIHQLTEVPANLYGLRDRGVLTPGAHADVVVLDETTIGSRPVEVLADLPGGAPRLYAAADGIEQVLVNGEVIVEGDVITETRPGTMIRSGRHTKTAPLGHP